MNVSEAIGHLNAVAAGSIPRQEPLRTMQELRNFYENPPKGDHDLPCETITVICEAFKAAGAHDRQDLVRRIHPETAQLFLQYASGMAVMAVRRESPELVILGLVALTIEGGNSDLRDSITALAKLHHSALKLGQDTAKLFVDVASLAINNPLGIEMSRFPFRSQRDRDLGAFLLSEKLSDQGFTYEQDSPVSARSLNDRRKREQK